MIIIYRLFNDDGLSYVGSTAQSLTRRFIEHKSSRNNPRSGSFLIYKNKKNSDVKIEKLETCSKKNRFDREYYWLKKYKNTTNKCIPWQGPKGFKPYDYQIDIAKQNMKKRWVTDRPALLKQVNANKTVKFQQMASAASHKKKYERMPVKEVFCSSSGKKLGEFKTQPELCKILGLCRKTVYKFTHGMGLYKDKFIISEVTP